MAIRRDGLDTRNKLLQAAGAVFAEKGYRDATVAEICRRAGANVAAVNYYFKGKDELYATAWRNAFDETIRVYPPDGGLPPDSPAPERLRALIRSELHRVLDHGRLGHAGKLLLMEMTNPTDAIEHVRRDAIHPLFIRTRNLMREMLGPRVDETRVTFCQMSVIHQCLALGFRRGKLPSFLRHNGSNPLEIDVLAEHIAVFSLAGIQAVRDEAAEIDLPLAEKV